MPQSDCNVACAGNSTEACGGLWIPSSSLKSIWCGWRGKSGQSTTGSDERLLH